jgi:hypothetical protein
MKARALILQWLSTGLAAALAMLTAVWGEWIEGVTGLNLDHRNHSVEWLLVAGLMCISVVSGRGAWRRTRGLPQRVEG